VTPEVGAPTVGSEWKVQAGTRWAALKTQNSELTAGGAGTSRLHRGPVEESSVLSSVLSVPLWFFPRMDGSRIGEVAGKFEIRNSKFEIDPRPLHRGNTLRSARCLPRGRS
jgi:hypothetical protein